MDNAIDIVDLSFSYPDGRQALSQVTLSVPQGEAIAFIGPNGAGKTTLLLHLDGLLRGNGAVRILGVPVEERHLRWVRQRVGLVFQNPDDQLFCPTVFDDVAFGPLSMGLSEDEVRRRVKRALTLVGMSGLEGRPPYHLSLGQKKRVAMATVLSMDAQILVLDEPSANLDPAGKWELIEMLREMEMTKVVASHDLELVASLCQRAVVLDGGRIVADGDTKDILGDRSLLEEHHLARRASARSRHRDPG
jgi:cobalt/nickel transport system ATP-binding protein